ncbi:FKBP-type peptidyl-prolyl cis-trans isomerase [Phenylobacterium sp.]|uniref:FKBP-type peptidyl-prolyl cis-trans isomerase n=1 Tax=Phenylobacterium sp. TaxID=1871053 RepID=UPI002736DC68|nr:FKBP-type peptidyl-prolyl cis-trans isomerase [Phenylobacterium sp.]MDP3852983.1 FKBP-type peptidyl-prolyl cis-trans isomerase [Phenylobacterium sp.]
MKRLIVALAAVLALAGCNRAGDADAAKAAAEAKTYMATNARAEGVKSLPSGVQYKIVRSGAATGLKPGPSDEVKVHYEGKLVSGAVFDSSYERGAPAAMPLPALIPAWKEALQQMRPGDEWVLYVPPEMGYGAEGQGAIPPNSVLIFRIELIDVLPAPGRIGQG